jgi:hypothetical protein
VCVWLFVCLLQFSAQLCLFCYSSGVVLSKVVYTFTLRQQLFERTNVIGTLKNNIHVHVPTCVFTCMYQQGRAMTQNGLHNFTVI